MVKKSTVYGAFLMHTFIITMVCLMVWAVLVPSVYALTYTNDNFHDVRHEMPAHFEQRSDGSFWGYTETGREFTQTPIPNQYDVRLHKFVIDEAFFYTTDRGVIHANTDIQALSMYFARA